MRLDFIYTNAKNGGFGTLGKGIHNALIEAGHTITQDDPDVVVAYGTPDVLLQARERHPQAKLIYYTVWESSKYPEDWIKQMKSYRVDLVLTAAKFTQESLRRGGIESKVWHHGIDDRWKYKPRRDDGVFTFIHYNAYEWRKGWEIVLGAFMEEFGPDEPVKLVMKARDVGEGLWLRPVNEGASMLDIPNVVELLGHLSDQEMVDFVEEADCGVFPVKGEGWFLPATECVAQGIPVIMPNQMAMSEQWGTGYIDLEIEGWFKSEPRYYGAMIQPSKQDLKRKMRWAFDNEKSLRKLGKIGSKEVYEKFNWRKIIADLEVYIKSVI